MRFSMSSICYAGVFTASAVFTGSFIATGVVGQGPPPARYHTAIQSSGATTVSASERLSWNNRVSIEVRGNERVIKSNGIPAHRVGRFPNRGNPHEIEEQDYEFTMPAKPEFDGRAREIGMRSFGVAVNGVPFDPSAAEW